MFVVKPVSCGLLVNIGGYMCLVVFGGRCCLYVFGSKMFSNV